MRVYLPATAADLTAPALSPRTAHAATASLAAALPEEDQEGLEVSASLCAADSSLVRLSRPEADGSRPEADGLADRRVVVAADVAPEHVRELAPDEDVLPGTVQVTAPVPWDDVASLLVDEAAAEADVRAARGGDEAAFERAAEADLLWYDVCEREHLAAGLTRRP